MEFTPALGNTFLYHISKGMVMLPAAPVNPVTSLPIDFETKEYAFKAATWVVNVHRRAVHFSKLLYGDYNLFEKTQEIENYYINFKKST